MNLTKPKTLRRSNSTPLGAERLAKSRGESKVRTTEKFFMPLLIGGKPVNSAFHDLGAVVTCIGLEEMREINPHWEKEYPEVPAIPLVSHTNHNLKVIGARLVPLSIPGTDIELLHPIHIEKGGRDLVIGRDLLIRCKIGLEWRGDELLVATIPSPVCNEKIWEIPVFNTPVTAELVYNVCLLYTSPSPRDGLLSRMPSSA